MISTRKVVASGAWDRPTSPLSIKTFNSESTCGLKTCLVYSYGEDVGLQRMYINNFCRLSSSRIFHNSISVPLKQEIMNAWLCAFFFSSKIHTALNDEWDRPLASTHQKNTTLPRHADSNRTFLTSYEHHAGAWPVYMYTSHRSSSYLIFHTSSYGTPKAGQPCFMPVSPSSTFQKSVSC